MEGDAASIVCRGAGPRPGGDIFTGNKGAGMAKRTFKDTMAISSGANRIELHYSGVRTPTATPWCSSRRRASLHMADVFASKGLPGMDADDGGTSVGYADTLTKVADFADKVNVQEIIDGHFATTTTRADIRECIQ